MACEKQLQFDFFNFRLFRFFFDVFDFFNFRFFFDVFDFLQFPNKIARSCKITDFTESLQLSHVVALTSSYKLTSHSTHVKINGLYHPKSPRRAYIGKSSDSKFPENNKYLFETGRPRVHHQLKPQQKKQEKKF